jgi:hypothetical protein
MVADERSAPGDRWGRSLVKGRLGRLKDAVGIKPFAVLEDTDAKTSAWPASTKTAA